MSGVVATVWLCFGFVSVLYFGLGLGVGVGACVCVCASNSYFCRCYARAYICGYPCLCFVSGLCLCFVSGYVYVKEITTILVKGTLTHPQATVVHPKGSYESAC